MLVAMMDLNPQGNFQDVAMRRPVSRHARRNRAQHQEQQPERNRGYGQPKQFPQVQPAAGDLMAVAAQGSRRCPLGPACLRPDRV
jgi:hypothetical protein